MKEEIQLGIQELKIDTLKDLIRLARVEEAKMEAWIRRSRLTSTKPASLGGFQKSNTVLPPKTAGGGMLGLNSAGHPNLESSRTLPIKGLTIEYIADKKKKKGLCFLCDEPYFMGHQCKKPHLFMMLLSDDCPLDCDQDEC